MDFLETLGKILVDFKTFSPIICGDDVTIVLNVLKMHSIAELYILLTLDYSHSEDIFTQN